MSQSTERPRRSATTLAIAAFAAVGLAGVTLWTSALWAPEAMLARGYEAALADADAGSMRATPVALAESGEHKRIDAIWPGNAGRDNQGLRRPLALGDRITIASREGRPDKLLVVELKQIDGAAVGAPGVRFQLVTSRLDGAPEGQVVNFLIAVEPDAGARAAAGGDRTL